MGHQWESGLFTALCELEESPIPLLSAHSFLMFAGFSPKHAQSLAKVLGNPSTAYPEPSTSPVFFY